MVVCAAELAGLRPHAKTSEKCPSHYSLHIIITMASTYRERVGELMWDVATLRLAPVLPTNVAVVQFPDVRRATEAVVQIMNQGVGIRTCLHP